MQSQIQKLIKHSKNPELIKEVFEFAQKSYGQRKRASGENYIDHAVNVALILSDMGLDQTTIAGGILHDVTDIDKEKQLQEIKKRFGQEIAHIVQKNSELKKIYYSFYSENKNITFTREKSENLRKMFLAIAGDLRVALIDIASRIDGLHNIKNFPKEYQMLYATETMEIFVPIANRLGLGETRAKLEDLAFELLFPDKFNWLKEHIKEQYKERQAYLAKFIPHFKRMLKKERIRFLDINYRAKSYWSTYQKLLRHQMDFEKIYDLVALRLIVKDVATCYKVLGIIHKHYQPISGQIQDYIAKPKENGYKSLHTTVFLELKKLSEIQIKTDQMHQEAEHGVCAHWAYKEKIDLSRLRGNRGSAIPTKSRTLDGIGAESVQKEEEKFGWVSKVPEFWNTFKIDFFSDQVFAFTPKGDVVVLPKDSTPIDFAYALHSEIGNHCESAKIDGKIITLNQILKNGDVVEIITNKKRKPSYDWLKFVKTNFAKSHIKKLITGIPVSLLSVPGFVKKKIAEISQKAKKIREEKIQIKKEKPSQVYLAGQKGMMVTMAKCCLPKPGDMTKAYLTKYRAAVLHKISCNNFQKISKKFPEKIIDATWEKS